MAANTYRNPRYMPDHAFRSESTDIVLGSDLQVTPLSRIVDDQNTRAFEFGSMNNLFIDFERLTDVDSPSHVVLGRFIVAGTNILENRTGATVSFSEDDVAYTQRKMIDGSEVGLVLPTGPLDFEVELFPSATEWPRFERLTVWGATPVASNHQVGEVYSSRILTTSSGIVSSWSDDEAPNNVVAETFAHNTYVLERGDTRRVWTMRYQRINDADMQTLDEIYRIVGLQTHPFWFDPPASGNTYQVNTIWDPEGLWTSSADTTLVQNPTGGPNGTPSVSCTNDLQDFTVFQESLSSPVNLSGKLLQFDMRQEPSHWVQDNKNFLLRIASPSGNRSEYNVSDGWLHAPTSEQNDWQRFQIDPFTSPVNSSAVGRADISSVERIGFVIDNQAEPTGSGCEIANLTIVEKAETVKFVEMMNFQKRQSAPSSKFNLRWDVDITVREVLS